jgi:uncharacterized protein YdhG (YjbR/CyaY superfamily)
MKQARLTSRRSAAKAGDAPKSIDEYLAGVPEPARSTLNRIRAAIRSALPPGYSTSKGTIRFPVDQPLPATLVEKIVKARVAQNEKRKRG